MSTDINSFYVTVPKVDGDLYFTTDGWYYAMIPIACSTGIYRDYDGTEMSDTMPRVFFRVQKVGAVSTDYLFTYYFDQISYPILIAPSYGYKAGDTFKISVIKGYMENYPAKDYTVKLYSKHDIKITNSNGKTNMIHMDGQYPSGFTESKYCGPYCDQYNQVTTSSNKYTGPPEDATTMIELLQSAPDVATFLSVLLRKPYLIFIWFKFW